MADELPCPLRNTGCDLRKQRPVQSPGDFNSEGSIGCDKAFRRTAFRNLPAKVPKILILRPACPEIGSLQKFIQSQRKARTERIPDGSHPALSAAASKRGRNTFGKIWVCLCVSRCDTHTPAA